MIFEPLPPYKGTAFWIGVSDKYAFLISDQEGQYIISWRFANDKEMKPQFLPSVRTFTEAQALCEEQAKR
jgi:hypothetical protein